MKVTLTTAILVVLVPVSALAGDGNVPQSTLASLGLGGTQVMSDEEGMQVRGTYASSQGFSMYFIVIAPFGSHRGFQDWDVDYDANSNGNGSVSASSSVSFPGFRWSSGGVTVRIRPFTVSAFGTVCVRR